MLRAAYPYSSEAPTSLSFQEGDQFTLLEKTDQHWWHVMNHLGQTGYVPAKYIEKDQSSNDEVLRSIDRAIEFIHLASTEKGGSLSQQQRDNLQKLVQHRQSILSGNTASSDGQPKRKAPDLPRQTSTEHRKAPLPPTQRNSSPQREQAAGLSRSTRTSTKIRAAPKPPQRNESVKQSPQDQADSGSSSQALATSTPKSTSKADRETPNHSQMPSEPVIPKGLLGELVEQVRIETDLSYDMSKQAVGTVLERVGSAVPEVANVMAAILSSLTNDLNMTSSNIIIEGSRDHERLEVIFKELTACKDDAQQRSWALHEDEAIISGHLEELITILSDADPRVCKAVVKKDHFEYIQNLVLYYQMELRSSLRLLLLKVFGALCNLDRDALSSLLCSVLPVELARDMMTDQENIPKLCYSALVCTMLLSTGEQIPFSHYDQLNAEFVNYLLDSMDNPPPADELDQVPDLFVNLILAFNLHLRVPAESIVMKVLAERRSAKTFSEKIMLLVNRGVDPVKVFDHCSDTQDSLLKFMADMFSSPVTSDLFYSNDMKVLIDIIVRLIKDSNPGDQVRTEYLSLIFSIFINTSYWEDCHRLSELESAFVAIAIEEGQESEQDQLIVKEIQQKFGSKFTGQI
ncbi:NCK-interacting protein with SH3 domain [Strongylocentrotus purpuratus]|uniref:NCK-interacting protein with SH3 domain n=1 Tax=Strongylocentrotus purpuratus TaxID=7668 RepID=A0A7M7SYU7_STRPU|nr:NCK-interacting protein with SH3 domain [Strongylocentrotus purpuratus]